MLSEFLAVTTLVVTDVDRAKAFYQDELGLTLLEETPASCRFAPARDHSSRSGAASRAPVVRP